VTRECDGRTDGQTDGRLIVALNYAARHKSKGKFTHVRTAEVSGKPVMCDTTQRPQCSSACRKYVQPAICAEIGNVYSDAVDRIDALLLTLRKRQARP